MSHFDPHHLESEQPLFEKPVYSNISNTSSNNSTSRDTPNGQHYSNHHRSSSSANHQLLHPQSPTSIDDEDVGALDLKAQQELQWNLQTQSQALEARVSKLQARLIILGGVTVIGFNIIIVLCAVFFTKLHYDIAHHTHKPKLGAQMAVILQDGLCVPCEDFRLGPSREEESRLDPYRDESSGSGRSAKCCVDKPEDLLELLKLYIERRFRQELARGEYFKYRAECVAHRLFYSVPFRGRLYEIDKWLDTGDMAFATGGAYHQHGRIVVPSDGYYFVYRCADSPVFMLRMKSCSSFDLSYNMLYTKGGEEKLAQNSITRCWGQKKRIEEYTSSLGAVFFLRQKDEIFIKVSNMTILLDDPKSSFFGFFRI
ncbi:hypothetical protein EGW08_002713 [Elysia chlorotica]|uniref:THD domain-containing protein n=1 Tax=Elysia chlorotica TaxID=188477 RepID=A0A433U6S0_ELYCH|nr:hypothetical protein EGW08_002713 [Elysia chlorotica]